MTISSERLLPCPFCGSDFLLGQEPYDNHPVAGQFYLYHRYGAIGSAARSCPIEVRGHFDTAAEAIAAWNRRSGGREAVGAIADIAAERRRQVEVEGWTPEHDDEHAGGEMASAAGVYALAAGSQDYRWVVRGSPVNDYLAAAMKLWPWEASWFKPKDRRRDLVRAGALIAAEIDRLDRRTLKDNTHGA